MDYTRKMDLAMTIAEFMLRLHGKAFPDKRMFSDVCQKMTTLRGRDLLNIAGRIPPFGAYLDEKDRERYLREFTEMLDRAEKSFWKFMG